MTQLPGFHPVSETQNLQEVQRNLHDLLSMNWKSITLDEYSHFNIKETQKGMHFTDIYGNEYIGDAVYTIGLSRVHSSIGEVFESMGKWMQGPVQNIVILEDAFQNIISDSILQLSQFSSYRVLPNAFRGFQGDVHISTYAFSSMVSDFILAFQNAKGGTLYIDNLEKGSFSIVKDGKEYLIGTPMLLKDASDIDTETYSIDTIELQEIYSIEPED